MTVQGGFTSAGQSGPDSAHHQPSILASPSTTNAPQTEVSSSSVLVNPDLHRQSHSSSKLPAFRFTDRRSYSSGSIPLANKGGPLCISTNQYNLNRNHNLDLRNNNKTDLTKATTSASTPTSPPATTDSASAAPFLQKSLEKQEASSTVSPNPDPSIAPTVSLAAPSAVASTSASADPAPDPAPDPGPLAPPDSAVSGTVTETDPVPAPTTLPAAAHPNTSHPTTHQRDEKHAVSASTTASTSAIASVATDLSANATQPNEPKSINEITSPLPSQSHSRASSVQPSSSVARTSQTKRPASYLDASAPEAFSPHPAKTRTRRPLISRRSTAASSSTGPPPSLNSERLQAIETAQEGQSSRSPSSDNSPINSPSGQRELILPKTLLTSNSTDERRASLSQRPPVSYRPPLNTNNNTEPSSSTPVRVPPIRAFRSSGSRRSLTLDMNSRSRFHDFGDDVEDADHDRTLRALEGREDNDVLHSEPAYSSRRDVLDNDDTGDVFLKIAREEASRRQPSDQPSDDNRSVVSRATRFTHRRPLSSVVPINQPTSPPQFRRRLSEQETTSRSRSRGYDDDKASEVTRMSTYRSFTREKAASAHPGEDSGRARGSVSTTRPSPVTPRSIIFQEPSSEHSLYSRRRSSITDNNSTVQNRSSAHKFTGYSHNKTYNSSPLVRSFDFQHQSNLENGNGHEGTNSTLSTTAPSTVWDELDDLKSRIHRLELTGKLPSTSGAAVSRLSDERPPTATTTVTTMSSSPKRVEKGTQNADVLNTASAHRESHSILQSALAKSKVLLDAEVYQALESAANDAMALASMMGTPGQPGPISSGASTIGSGAAVTDRQLRRKAESVCRSLTELCLALGENVTQTRAPRQSVEAPATAPTQSEAPTTPTINKTFTGFTSQRRQSNGNNEQNLAKASTSPRTMSKFEERRLSILNGSSLPTSRMPTTTPSTPLEPVSNRRSSLMVSRSRRAGTEEPDDGRKSSLLLRTRRAGTEEPDEGRRTSLFVRSRRNTVGEESEDESRFRTPSRVNTDLNTIRVVTQQDQTPQSQQTDTTSAIPRRRFVSSNLGVSRLATPSVNTATPPRRYVERPTQQDHSNGVANKLAEERAQHYTSLGQTTFINRSGSMIRRPNRESIASANPSTAAGGYR
ncbi:hypothetical protein F66182_8630 [Fusarium sp. NRRL 66182]|nr:hypothetical protein F66182_8630 [Fusarium sp. NRRL 66182]